MKIEGKKKAVPCLCLGGGIEKENATPFLFGKKKVLTVSTTMKNKNGEKKV